MISNFWKKITIYNAALLIIFLRVYGPLINYVEENSDNNTIFAKYSESGYAFKDSLQYNLDDINRVSTSLINKYKNNNFLIPIPQITSNKCNFLNKLEICKENKQCFEEINNIKEGNFSYHKQEEYNKTKILNNDMIIKIIQDNNQFLYEKNNMIEIPFFNQLIDGYSSYLYIFSNDINLIKQVTQDENKMNNLLFLYVLYIKSFEINDKIINDININKLLEYQDENIKKILSSLDKFKKEQIMLLINNILRDNVLNCIPNLDTRYSFLIDFESIYSMLQILFNDKKNKFNNKMFNFLFFKLTNKISNIFALDIKIKERSKIFSLIQKYCFYTFWAIAAIIIFYCNNYFIRHKEFYKSKTRTVKNVNSNAEFKKYLIYQKNIQKLQKNNRNKYTPEEIEMINKLTKEQKDYIISK